MTPRTETTNRMCEVSVSSSTHTTHRETSIDCDLTKNPCMSSNAYYVIKSQDSTNVILARQLDQTTAHGECLGEKLAASSSVSTSSREEDGVPEKLDGQKGEQPAISSTSTKVAPLVDVNLKVVSPYTSVSVSSQNTRFESSPGRKLIPFSNQVGGHECVLRLSERIICKPLRERERLFYESVRDVVLDSSSLIKTFLPEYYGTAKLELCRKNDHQLLFNVKDLNGCPLVDSSELVDLLRTTSSSVSTQFDGDILDHPAHVQTSTSINPWLTQLLERKRNQMESQGMEEKEFILLEDLTYGFRYPCVLDVKIGTRQHGLNVSLEKKERHKALCASTTSSLLGLRICGVQVYEASSGGFRYENKYEGRLIGGEEFNECLLRFFHNGKRILVEYILLFIEKLQNLITCLEQLQRCRFFCSSVLFVYDGDVTQRRAVLKLIDFDHSSIDITQENLSHESDEESLLQNAHFPDQSCLFGLYNLKRSLETLKGNSDSSPFITSEDVTYV